MYIQRFKSALTCGHHPDNPEDLLRDENGKWVKYEDMQKLLLECMEWNWGEDEYEDIPIKLREKFEALTQPV